MQFVMGLSMFSNSFRLEAQGVPGLRPNSDYRSFATEIAAVAKEQQQRQQGAVTIAGIPKADFSSLGNYAIYPVRRLLLTGGKDSVHRLARLEIGEATLLIIQPVPYKGSLFVFDVKKHSLNALVDLSRYEVAFRYGNDSSLSFGYFLESEKYLGQIPIIADPVGHSVSFLEQGSGTLAQLPELLHQRYGGIDRLRQQLEQEQDENEAKEEAFRNFDPVKDAAGFLSKDWQVRSRYLPHDTAANIQLLLSDISASLDIDGNRLQAVLPSLEAHLRLSSPDAPVSVHDLSQMVLFMGKDINRDLGNVLSEEQLKQYRRHLDVWKWRFKAVDIYVYTVYLKGPYSTMEEKSNAYKEYMLSFYKN